MAIFPEVELSSALAQDLRRMNPWWEDRPLPVLPRTRRHLVAQLRRRLDLRLAPAVVVRGPRQIGKTTAQLQVLQELLASGVPPRNVFRVQADELPEIGSVSEPILRLVDWYEQAVLGATLNEAAHRGEPTYLFFDEVQNLTDWAPQIKSLVDHATTQVLITGSSALRIEQGRDSLAQLPQFAEGRSSIFRHLAEKPEESRHYISVCTEEIRSLSGNRKPSRSSRRA